MRALINSSDLSFNQTAVIIRKAHLKLRVRFLSVFLI